jgi:hypothetical protein
MAASAGPQPFCQPPNGRIWCPYVLLLRVLRVAGYFMAASYTWRACVSISRFVFCAWGFGWRLQANETLTLNPRHIIKDKHLHNAEEIDLVCVSTVGTFLLRLWPACLQVGV